MLILECGKLWLLTYFNVVLLWTVYLDGLQKNNKVVSKRVSIHNMSLTSSLSKTR